MLFAHDVEMGLQSGVALVNSAVDPDTLTTVDDLARFFTEFDYSGRRDGSADELAAVRALRPRLRALLTADEDEAVRLLNEMLRETHALPQLVRHDGYDWHLHAVESDRPLAERILVETAMAVIDLIRLDELSRLDVCADDDCEGVVLDLSRNRSKRFCSTTCGNRNAAAAYRARQADDA
jgi:predicted RNA-binding Zn ribbon-like protein